MARSKVMPVRLSEEEHAHWRALAEARGWTVSQMLREAVRLYDASVSSRAMSAEYDPTGYVPVEVQRMRTYSPPAEHGGLVPPIQSVERSGTVVAPVSTGREASSHGESLARREVQPFSKSDQAGRKR